MAKGNGKAVATVSEEKPLKPLSVLERTFLEHYIACRFNGTEAARRMGIKDNGSNPRVRTYQFLQRPHVQKHLELMRAELPTQFPNLLEKAMRTYDDILEFDRREVFTDQGSFVGIKALTFEQAGAIRKIKFDKDTGGLVELEFESKKAAADAVIDRLRPENDHGNGAPGAAGIGQMPATVIINVQGVPLDQSFRVISLEEQGLEDPKD